HPDFLAGLRSPERAARDTMSAPVVTVGEQTDINEIARLLTAYRIKRVPVVRDGRIVGIVSRADLVRALAAAEPSPAAKPTGGLLAGALVALDRPRGVMTIQNAAGYILALFVFEVRDDLYEGRILYLDYFMVPNVAGRRRIWDSAIGAAENLARLNGCRAIRAELGGELERSDENLLTSLERSGYSPAGVRTLKRLKAKSSSAEVDSAGTIPCSQLEWYHA